MLVAPTARVPIPVAYLQTNFNSVSRHLDTLKRTSKHRRHWNYPEATHISGNQSGFVSVPRTNSCFLEHTLWLDLMRKRIAHDFVRRSHAHAQTEVSCYYNCMYFGEIKQNVTMMMMMMTLMMTINSWYDFELGIMRCGMGWRYAADVVTMDGLTTKHFKWSKWGMLRV